MFCSNCGTQNEDNVMFCRNCGTPLRQGGGANQMNPAAPVYRGGPRQAGGQLVNALSELIQSPLYLVATIALTSQILLAVIAAVTGYSQLGQMLHTIMSNSGMQYSEYYYQIAPALNTLSAASVPSVLIGNLPTILIITALWIEFASAKSNTGMLSTTGFTMIRVITIIRLIFICLGLAVAVIATFVGVAAASRYMEKGSGALIAISIILFAVVGFLVIFYQVKILGMLGSAKDVIMIGTKTSQASLYVIVLTFIAGGFSCISAISALVTSGFLGFLSTAAAATASIAFGMLMLRFNTLESMNVSGARVRNTPVPAMHGMAGGAGRSVPRPPVNNIPNASGDMGAPGEPAYRAPAASPTTTPDQPVSPGVPPFIPPKPGTVVMGFNDDEFKKMQYANEGTVVLNVEAPMPSATLTSANGLTQFRINKPDFVIGKAYGSVDGFIDDNPAISRKHAKIVLNDNKFYIVDLNSTNHVYVDGKAIPADTPIPIIDGTKIRLADELFTFNEKA